VERRRRRRRGMLGLCDTIGHSLKGLVGRSCGSGLLPRERERSRRGV